VKITEKEARNVIHYTDGWVIAVYLQLRAYQETGEFSDTAIITLMEHLIWEKLTEPQQEFLLRLSPFETITLQHACTLSGFETLPGYAKEALQIPFIRNEQCESRYELHSILVSLLRQKCRERGQAFERECILRAGDLCRDSNRKAEALAFFWQVKDYERILSIDFSA